MIARLARLFRAERRGLFERRPPDMVATLLQRRGRCITLLLRLEQERRRHAPGSDPVLDAAVVTLGAEIDAASGYVSAARVRAGAELRQLRGQGEASGLPGSSSGTILGRG